MTLSARQGPGNANQASTRSAKYLTLAATGHNVPNSVSSTGNHFNSSALSFAEASGNSISIAQSNTVSSANFWSATGNNTQDGGTTGNLYIGATGQFTIESWLYFNTRPNAGGTVGFYECGTGGFSITLNYSSGNNVMFAATNQAVIGTFTWASGQTFASNTWTHLAVQRSAYAANGVPAYSAWINGVIANNAPIYSTRNFTGTNPTSSITTPAIGVAIGGKYLGSGTGNVTQMQEFRISNIARYAPTGNITVPSTTFVNDPNTLLLIHGSSATTDDNS